MVFPVLKSSKEKPILKIMLMKTKPNRKQFYLPYPLVHISDSMDEPRQLSTRNVVVFS